MTGNGLVYEFDAHEFLCRTLGLLLSQRLLTNELLLVELYEHRQTSHHGCDILREFVAIEWQSHLEAQGITATQTTRLHTSVNQLVPALTDKVVRAIHLEAILAGIAGSRDD